MDRKDEIAQALLPHKRETLPQVTTQTVQQLQAKPFWKKIGKHVRKQKSYKTRRSRDAENWEAVNAYISRLAALTGYRYNTSWDWIHHYIFPWFGITAIRYNDQIFFYSKDRRQYIFTNKDIEEIFAQITKVIDKDSAQDKNNDLYHMFCLEEDVEQQFFNRIRCFLFSSYSIFQKLKTYDGEIELFFLHDGVHWNSAGLTSLICTAYYELQHPEFEKELKEKLRYSDNKIDVLQSFFGLALYKKEDGAPFSEQEVNEILYPTTLETCLKYTKNSFTNEEIARLRWSVETFKQLVPKDKYEMVIRNLVKFFSRYQNVSLLSFFPPSKKEFLALFYCYSQVPPQASKIRIPEDLPRLSPMTIQLRQIMAQYALRTSQEYWEMIAQGYSDDELKSGLYEQLCIPLRSNLLNRPYDWQNVSEDYVTLRSIVGEICHDDTNKCISLLRLIARIVLGRDFYDKFIKEKEPSVFVIVCQNPLFISEFLKDIFYSQLIREYSFSYLSDPKHVSQLLNDIMQGVLVNITTKKQNTTMPSESGLVYLKKLLSGKKLRRKELIGTASYSYTIPCIYLSTTDDLPKSIRHVSFSLPGDISNKRYPRELTTIEKTVFCTGALCQIFSMCYGANTASESVKENLEKELPNVTTALTTFINSFCDKDPRLKGYSEDEIKEYLNLSDPFYEIKADVQLMLGDWYKATYNAELNLNQQSLRNPFGELFSSLLYRKRDHIIRQYGAGKGENTCAKVLYGMKVRYEEFKNALQELQQTKNHVDIENQREEFDLFFDEIISKGKECIAAQDRY